METLSHYGPLEQTNQPEVMKNPWPNKSALHVRLLAQNSYLDPHQPTLGPIDAVMIGDIATHDYSLYEKISHASRSQYYQDQAIKCNSILKRKKISSKFLHS